MVKGQHISFVRRTLGMNRENFSRLFGVDEKTLRKLERTNGEIPEKYALRLRDIRNSATWYEIIGKNSRPENGKIGNFPTENNNTPTEIGNFPGKETTDHAKWVDEVMAKFEE